MKRIVSLLPSATEICFALGIEDQLVGVTHECDFPDGALTKPKITRSKASEVLSSREIDELVRSQLDTTGSIYELDLDELDRLRPDIILTQQLCTVCAVSYDYVRDQAARLATTPEVINLEPKSLEDVFDSIKSVAELAGVKEKAEELITGLRQRVENVRSRVAGLRQPRTLVLEWVVPPFASGHWIPELVEIAGGENALSFIHAPSREVRWEQVQDSQAEIVIIAECGFGVARQQQDVECFLSRIGSATPQVWVCDGSQYFSRPGPRLVDTLEIITGVLHQELRKGFLSGFTTNDVVQIQ